MGRNADIDALASEIKGHATECGLDFFETIFEVLDFDDLNEVAAYGGFPNRYPHWRFGMEYEQLQKGYAYGLQKIYEMVINNDPCYAYLMMSNNLVDQKLVIAHVYAHCDFFKNNMWFSKTNRKMMDEMANHATKIRRYVDKYGQEEVEDFVDVCLSLENLVDYHLPFAPADNGSADDGGDAKVEESSASVHRLKTDRSYMDSYINPPDFLESQKEASVKDEEASLSFPPEAQKDILLFLLEHAPLTAWQQDVLAMVREEAYYFAPQGQTKIMNEGWATYWHSRMMTERILQDSELIDYADHHSGTLQTSPGRLNPYKVGVELLRNIEDRWNKGRFGKEWDECDDMKEKQAWDKDLGLGREKVFDVRRLYNDITFIDAYLTPEFCAEHLLFAYEYDDRSGMYHISDREFQTIKQKLLLSLTNFGYPFVYAENGNHANRGELYLRHRHEGVDLQLDEAQDVLTNLYKIWRRPVWIQTAIDDRPVAIWFDGEDHDIEEIGSEV